jgi:hypothetical protein
MRLGVVRYSAASQGAVLRAIVNLLGHCFSAVNVLLLCFLRSASEQQNNLQTNPREVNAITGAVVDAQFADAFADRLYIAKVAEREAVDSCENPCNCLIIR